MRKGDRVILEGEHPDFEPLILKGRDREALIREMAGWMTRAEANALRQSLKVFEKINEGDWN
jgi:hypothetical protein